ncbi:hypothetical protein [Acidithiobacillus concretivorus]|uniref:Transposase n=1 Tax=Acidithiobacillus concretivorus TaxID=3063952 RepID=A0ABS5ZTI1_9PROT|nr:hypothetical protein [Acidithiobacillus concretivorus]MBU2739710.1 hypothetical protein [Acidithiobacillus concretivorus]
MDRFLSIPWMEAYAAHCSADASLAAALKGFNASIEYGWLDKDYPKGLQKPRRKKPNCACMPARKPGCAFTREN